MIKERKNVKLKRQRPIASAVERKKRRKEELQLVGDKRLLICFLSHPKIPKVKNKIMRNR